MDSNNETDMSVPKTGEELIYIQQRLESEIIELANEFERVAKLTNTTETLCDINDAAWVLEEKDSLIEKLNQMNTPAIEDELPSTKPETFLKVLQTFQNINIAQQKSQAVLEDQISDLERKISDAECMLSLSNENAKSLEEGDSDINEIEHCNAKTKKDFIIYRKSMHGILEKYFNNTSLKKLVEDLIGAYFKGEDKYINITDGYSFGDVEILKQASLIKEHPEDNRKIQFCDMD